MNSRIRRNWSYQSSRWKSIRVVVVLIRPSLLIRINSSVSFTSVIT